MSIALLLVESEVHCAQALTAAVADQGLAWHVETASGVSQAQQALAQGSFDVVLVRYKLVDGNAFDLCDVLGLAPTLICISPGQEFAASRALSEGFTDYVLIDPAGAWLAMLAAQVQAAMLRSQTTARLQDISERLDLALTHADMGWWERWQDSGSLALSDRACAMLGFAPDELVWNSTLLQQRIHPEDLPHLLAAAGSLGPASLLRWEYRVRHKLGHWVWVLSHGRVVQCDAQGEPLRVCGTVMDVSYAHKAEEQLRVAAQQLAHKSQLLELSMASISQGILRIAADGTVLHYNQRLCELLELPVELMARNPNIREVFQLQRDRGDFGEEYSLAFPGVRQHLAAEFQHGALSKTDLPVNYWRKTRSGRFLEVKSKIVADGGWVRTFSDVTDYFETKQALSASEERFRGLTQLSSDWYWEMDEQFRFVRFDGFDAHKAGMPQLEVIGMTRWALGALNMNELDWEEHHDVLRAHQDFRHLELHRLDGKGAPYWVSISGLPIFAGDGTFCGYRGVGQNITERKLAEQATLSLAFYDPLTTLPNRRLMLDRLGKALESAQRHQTQGALLFIDLDNFKTLNDTMGHDIGDELLRQVALRLCQCVRAIDTVSRLGGDEFIVMVEGLSAVPAEATLHAQAVGDKILGAFHAPFHVGGKLHLSSPSIGVTLFDGGPHSVEELLKQADLAMYQSKSAGRNTLRFFDPAMQRSVSERVQVEADLRVALQRDELLLHFQPVVDHDARLVGAEALVRWQPAQRAMVMPGDFIGVAEQTGLILPLGQRVLQLACERLAVWSQDARTAHLHLAVNVSAAQIRQDDFATQVLSVLEQTRAPASRLKLELTESLLLNDVEDIIEKMAALKRHGVGFALDDFGTGYSSLAYLNRLPLEQLKIDRSFVCNVLTDNNAAAIARTIVTLAHSLGLDVVAEGVETQGQREFLQALGCQSYQGYLFGRPAPEAELLRLLQDCAASLPA